MKFFIGDLFDGSIRQTLVGFKGVDDSGQEFADNVHAVLLRLARCDSETSNEVLDSMGATSARTRLRPVVGHRQRQFDLRPRTAIAADLIRRLVSRLIENTF